MKQIIVIGGGVAAAMSAAWIARMMPRASHTVTWLKSDEPSDFSFYEAGSELDEINKLFKISTGGFIHAGGGLPILGHKYTGRGADHIRPLGGYGTLMGGAAFHHILLRSGRSTALSNLTGYSAAASLAAAGKFAPGGEHKDGLLSTFNVGYTLRPERYAAQLEQAAKGLGVQVRAADSFHIERDKTGRVAVVNGVNCDLLVDTRRADKGALSLWDGVPGMATDGEETARRSMPAQPLITCARQGGETQVTLPLQGADITLTLSPNAEPVFGHASEPWTQNTIKVGEAAARIPAVSGFAMRMLTQDLARLTSLMPAQFTDPIEAVEYNRITAPTYNRLRDYLALHFSVGTPQLSLQALPEMAAAKYTLFSARGRFPVLDNEAFLNFDFINLFMGEAVIPRDYDIMAHAMSEDQIAAQLGRLETAIAQFVGKAPDYADLMTRMMQRNAA